MPAEDASGWQEHVRAWLNALAQVAFLDKPVQGALLLAAVGMLSPWSAVGAGLGAAIAVLAGRRLFDQSAAEWASGLGGYDGALVGLAWSGVLARGGGASALFPLAVLACLALRPPIWRLAGKWQLPVLGTPALITVWISVYVFTVLGADFWSFDRTPAPGMAEYAGAILAVAGAMAARNLKAAALAATGAAAAAVILLSFGDDPRTIGSAGLWAFTVAPALFAFPATLLPGCRQGWLAGLTAALAASLIWFAWPHFSLLAAVPPLMAPLFIGVWIAVLLVLGRDRDLFLDPQLQHAARLMAAARTDGGTCVLTGAGISTASGIPDYTSGAWLAPGVPLYQYGFQAFLAERGARILYWDACAWFHQCVAKATPNPGHRAVAALKTSGYVRSIVTQNVDGLHQAAGSSDVVELHGSIHRVHCLLCGATQPWPDAAPWRYEDMFCRQCGGFLKPAVIAFGEDVPPAAWREAQAGAVCKVLLVVGSQLAVSSASTLTAIARANGAACVFVTTGWLAAPVFPGDRVLVYAAERALPILAAYLGAPVALGKGAA
jgi:NAD-dependent deacetylase